MILQCKNTEYHKEPVYFTWTRVTKGREKKYCDDPGCNADLRKRQSAASQKRCQEQARTVVHRYRKKGARKCLTTTCNAKTNNYFGYCDNCRERRLSYFDSNYIVGGYVKQNGTQIIGRRF